MAGIGIKKPHRPSLRKQELAHYLTPSLVLVIGIVLAVFIAWLSFHDGREHVMLEYEKKINVIEAALYREMSLHVQALDSLSYVFHKNNPDFDTFTDISLQLIAQHPDVYGFEWIPVVPTEQRQNFETQMQSQFPDFQFTELNAAGNFIRAAERMTYYPVYYLAPMLLNPKIFGFDLGSDTERLAYLEKSRDSGLAKLSGPLTLLENRKPQTIVFAMLPLYQRSPLTVEDRRTQLKGFVSAVFRMEEIVLRSLGEESDHGRIMLIDADAPDSQNVLYQSTDYEQNNILDTYTYNIQMPQIWGRNWILSAAMPSQDYNTKTYFPALGVMIAGLLLSIFLAKYIQTILQRAALIRVQVAEKTRELEQRNEALQKLSTTDAMTGIANRRYMDEYLKQSWARAVREQTPITFAICDIDYFKLYNDTYGHLKGDECLRDVAEGLKKHLKRPSDLLARYGGEEFAIILSDTSDPDTFLRKCLKSIEQLRLPHKSSPIGDFITVSMGCFTTIPHRGGRPVDLIQTADAALYQAKQSGRNRLEISEKSLLVLNIEPQSPEQVEQVKKVNEPD